MIRDGIVLGLAVFGGLLVFIFGRLTFRAWGRYQIVQAASMTGPRALNAWHGLCAMAQHLVIVLFFTGALILAILVLPADRGPAVRFWLIVLTFGAWGILMLYGLQEDRYQREMWDALDDGNKKREEGEP